MTISFEKALGIHEQALLLREKRSEVLATNIANADTPGFKARDFDFEATLKNFQTQLNEGRGGHQRRHQAMSHTSRQHLPAAAPSYEVHLDELLYRKPEQASMDGNTVDEQTENAAFAENALRHQASFQFLNGRLTGMIKAIRGE